MGGSSTSTQTVSVPPDVLARYNAVNTRAEETSQRPFIPYGTDPSAFVAPLTATQQAGIYGTNVASTMAQPFYGQATNQLMGAQQAAVPFYGSAAQLNMQAARGISPQQINNAMSPYIGTVLQSTAALQNQMNQQAMSGQLGNAIRQGAYGGDRAGIAAANLAQQQRLADAKSFSDILNQGYGQAVGLAQSDRAALAQASQQQAALGQGLYGIGSGTSQQLAALGQGAQGAGLAGAQAQLAAGQTQQQTDQAGRTALYNQFLQQQSYPFQVAQFLANIAMGTGSLSGSTTTTNQPGGLFSDRRLKENEHVIGKTFDGQPIYKFNYKGDDTTHIGLMAQNVEKRHPEAVGLAGGYKTVDYDKATRDAAHRGHFATGGYASMGGGVVPSSAGEGFADGGYTGFDPMLMQQILANYQQMYGPMSGLGAAEGTITGAGRNIPMQSMGQHTLMTAGDLPKQASGIDQMKTLADAATEMSNIGSDVKDFFDKRKSKDENDEEDTEKAASGGLMGYSTGGVPLPYEKYMSGSGLDIPDEDPAKKALELQKPGQLENQPGTMGKIKKTADTIGSVAKAAGTVLALFSDKRLKENIKPIGKTFDGQTVYSYNYKGDKTTQIGLIAQEVARHHPKAVGLSGKYKTVDYDKATGLAAKRGHFAAGGDTEEEEEPDLLDLDATLMKGIKPDTSKSFLQQLMEESEASSKEEPEAEDKGEEAAAGAPAPVDAALNVADKAVSEPAPASSPVPSGLNSSTSKGTQTARKSKVRSVRNNNPGNIEDGPFAKRLPGYAGSDGRFAIFENPAAGRAAQMTLINSYIKRGFDTPYKIASRWAPPTENGNDVPMYAKKIAEMADVGIHDRVSASAVPQIANAQTIVEGGQKALQHFLPGKSEGGAADRHGYATDGSVEFTPGASADWADLRSEEDKKKDAAEIAKSLAASTAEGGPENIIPTDFGKIDTQAPTLTAAQARPILEKAIATKGLSPKDYADVYRSAVVSGPSGPEVAAQMPKQMSDLGIGIENAPAEQAKGVAPTEKKKESLGHRLFHPQGRTDYLVPLLTGVAGMIGAPTRNPFQALAYGVGAGAMGLQKQREFDLQRQMVGVRSGEAAANLMGKAISLYRPNPDPLTRGQFPWVDASGRPVTDAQRNSAVLGVVGTMGAVNPQFSNEAFKKLMSPEGGYQYPGAPTAPGAPAVPGAPAAPGVAPSAVPETAPVAAPKVAPKVEPKNIPTDVNARAASGFYRITPPVTPLDYSGLSDDNNPDKLRAFYNRYKGDANPAVVEQAKAARERATAIDTGQTPVNVTVTNPDGTVSVQAWNGWQQRKSDVERYETLRRGATQAANDTNTWSETFSQNRDKVLNVFQKLAAASADAELNRGSNYKANFIGYVASIPGLGEIVPESFRRFQSAADEGDKYAAAQQIMADVENKLTRAPAAGLQMAQRMAPGVTTAPTARYSYIVDNVAKILQDNAFNEFWNNNKNNIEDVARARQDWYSQNPLSKYMRRAIDQTPFSQGMPQEDRLKLISRKRQKAPVYQNGQLQMRNGKPVTGDVLVYYPTVSQKASLPDGTYYVANGKLVIKGARKAAQ